MELHLIQSREEFGPEERRAELREVWRRNEDIFDEYTHPEGRPTFAELFAMCKPDMVNVIANADIFFDGEFCGMVRDVFRNDLNIERLCLALSRWNVSEDGGSASLWDHADSNDVWIFYGIPRGIDSTYRKMDGSIGSISLGVAGCDNAIAHRIEQAGYRLFNPSRTIKAFHLHSVPYRSYLVDPEGRARGGDKIERIPPPYAFVQPTEL